MNRLAFIVLASLMSNTLLAQTDLVTFSRSGGFYEDSFALSLGCGAGHHIRYTVNGNRPTVQSSLYEGPLTLDPSLFSPSCIYEIVNCIPSTYHAVSDVKHAIVIRAAAFDDEDSCVSPVATQTYLIKSLGCDVHGLPVLSLNADSLDLFDYETGIFVPGVHYDLSDTTGTGNYCMTGREWERCINMEFYESDNSGLNQQCGLRTHGGSSRWFQQKGMRLYAREEYGKKRFKHRFFETTELANFKRLNLHPFRCSNWMQTGGQEYLSQRVAAQMDIDCLGVRQVAVFINGEYWGIYTLEESPDERYLEDHYDVDLDFLNIIKYWGVTNYGDATDWWGFRSWIESADLNQPSDSAYAFSRIDVSNFIDYCLLELYGANLDWPRNNVLQWQARSGEPFRFIFFDGDGCFSWWNYHALDNATHQDVNSLIINKFMESEAFKVMLYERYSELASTVFSVQALNAVLEDYRALVEEEVPSQFERFGFPYSQKRWQADMDSVSAFFSKRARAFHREMQTLFAYNTSLIEDVAVSPNPSDGAFTIHVTSTDCAIVPLEIFDMTGRLVDRGDHFLRPGDNAVTVHTCLRSGLYLANIGGFIKKIVIQ